MVVGEDGTFIKVANGLGHDRGISGRPPARTLSFSCATGTPSNGRSLEIISQRQIPNAYTSTCQDGSGDDDKTMPWLCFVGKEEEVTSCSASCLHRGLIFEPSR